MPTGIDALVGDLLYTDAYRGLTEEVHSARYLGRVEVEGTVCDHVAFCGEHSDWQLWVESSTGLQDISLVQHSERSEPGPPPHRHVFAFD